jgi:hypothetical protein
MSEAILESLIPIVEEVTIEDDRLSLADLALGLLRTLRDMENRKDEVDSKTYVTITTQVWAALDNITLRLFATCLKPQNIESN